MDHGNCVAGKRVHDNLAVSTVRCLEEQISMQCFSSHKPEILSFACIEVLALYIHLHSYTEQHMDLSGMRFPIVLHAVDLPLRERLP